MVKNIFFPSQPSHPRSRQNLNLSGDGAPHRFPERATPSSPFLWLSSPCCLCRSGGVLSMAGFSSLVGGELGEVSLSYGARGSLLVSPGELLFSVLVVAPVRRLFSGIDEPQVGYEVQGFIDGKKFDYGYLVTMKLGSQELKGVLYHIPQTPRESQPTMETPSAILPSSQRRHRKKSKLAVVDTQKPKCYRSGYNFFFADQYARLKPEYHAQERSITKKIGHMWSNLTESEKQVYQDKGVKDVEIYGIEMLEYKSSHESGAAASTVAQSLFSLLLSFVFVVTWSFSL